MQYSVWDVHSCKKLVKTYAIRNEPGEAARDRTCCKESSQSSGKLRASIE